MTCIGGEAYFEHVTAAFMTVSTQSLSQITEEAVRVLVRELGVARTLRFLGQYRTGTGDYTAERSSFLGDVPLDDLIEEAQRLDQEREA